MTWQPKLLPYQVNTIRGRWIQGEPQKDLAARYNVHPSTVHDIISRKTWKQLRWPSERVCIHCKGSGVETLGYIDISGA